MHSGDANAYPDTGAAWQPQRLYHSVIPFSQFGAMIQAAVEAGYIEPPNFGGDLPAEKQLEAEAAVTHVIDIVDWLDLSQDAMTAHATQFGENHPFQKIPRDMMKRMRGADHFIQVEPAPEASWREARLDDLFAGLQGVVSPQSD